MAYCEVCGRDHGNNNNKPTGTIDYEQLLKVLDAYRAVRTLEGVHDATGHLIQAIGNRIGGHQVVIELLRAGGRRVTSDQIKSLITDLLTIVNLLGARARLFEFVGPALRQSADLRADLEDGVQAAHVGVAAAKAMATAQKASTAVLGAVPHLSKILERQQATARRVDELAEALSSIPGVTGVAFGML